MKCSSSEVTLNSEQQLITAPHQVRREILKLHTSKLVIKNPLWESFEFKN